MISRRTTNTIFVYTTPMKNITLSADEELIDRARLVAKTNHTTLNDAFREWLEQFAQSEGRVQRYEALMNRLKYVESTGPYTRDELNER